jgi:hypothetical protein
MIRLDRRSFIKVVAGRRRPARRLLPARRVAASTFEPNDYVKVP